MSRADLHCHSKFSEHPSEWFLQRLGASESYTEPDAIYRTQRERGMDFVTITDHNRIEGALYLKEKYPDRVITGVETTTYFPEDRCKIHILVYGLDSAQFEMIQKIREDIYDLRDYLKETGLAYSVAHATYSVNRILTFEHVEKLILLFDVFETVNGGRDRYSNQVWLRTLQSLTPEHIEDLQRQYRIEPISDTPWIKGFTGGSDDHAALFLGTSYTEAEADTPAQFLTALRTKRTRGAGRNNTYQALAFTVYKIALDFLQRKDNVGIPALLTQATESLFQGQKRSWKNGIRMLKLKLFFQRKKNRVYRSILELAEYLKNDTEKDLDRKFLVVYDKMSDIADDLFRNFAAKIEKYVQHNDFVGVIRNAFSFIPSIFLSVPFFTSLKFIHITRHIAEELQEKYLHEPHRKKRILWFTDTLVDLNGPSVSLQEIGNIACSTGRSIYIVSSLLDSEIGQELPGNFINLPFVYSFRMPYYDKYTLKIPALLKAIRILDELEADEIFISTPGPVGLLGLLAARILNVRSRGIYHTDFIREAEAIIGNSSMNRVLKSVERWFYGVVDETMVPTHAYIQILKERGIAGDQLTLFRRGIRADRFLPKTGARSIIQQKLHLKEGFYLLYAGRVSEDKNMDFLAQVFSQSHKEYKDLYLIIAGDGPYLEEFRKKVKKFDHIVFPGRIPREQLVDYYSASDLLLFPSTTDTFGMVVLEAQACGLPALVSDVGGPQELVQDARTGAVLRNNSEAAWCRAVEDLYHLKHDEPQTYAQMRREARKHILLDRNWEEIMAEWVGESPSTISD